MSTLARRNSSIHKVREFSLPKINLELEYEVVAVLQEGWRGRLLLVEHRLTRNEVVLKAAHKDATTRIDFFREFHYNYYLSPHRNILNAYDVAFIAGDYYMFAQELAPFGDLTSNTSDTGIGEINTKKIACQIASALDFMHSKDLVHRDINMDNILVFKSDFSKVKLCDFGSTRKTGTMLKRKTVCLPYAPPEIVDAVQNEGYNVDTAQDVWQFGILIYVLLTGLLPWQKADLTDTHYADYINWRKRRTLRTPKRLCNFTNRFLRLMKRTLEPKPEKRATVKEVLKYINDKWLVKPVKKNDGDLDNQSVCYSTFSMHSSKLEKDKVLKALKDHGIETTVDRAAKRKRIHEWLERSITLRPEIMEEEDVDVQRTPSVKEMPSSPMLSSSDSLSQNKIKLSNVSSMYSILDEGYQTGSSSNHSSVKVNQMQSGLAKSTGNINTVIFNDRAYNAKAQSIIQNLQQQWRGSQTVLLEPIIIDDVNTLYRKHAHRAGLSQQALSSNHLEPSTLIRNVGVNMQNRPIQPSHYAAKDNNQIVKDHNQLVKEHNHMFREHNQQQMWPIITQNIHNSGNEFHSNKDCTASPPRPHLNATPPPSHFQQPSVGHINCSLTNQGGTATPVPHSRSRPREKHSSNATSKYEGQRMRTEAYVTRDSSMTTAVGNTSDGDSSASSVVVRMSAVEA